MIDKDFTRHDVITRKGRIVKNELTNVLHEML